jgi:hypothetical protein
MAPKAIDGLQFDREENCMTSNEILAKIHQCAVDTRERGNIRRDVHLIDLARADWYAASILDELLIELKKLDSKP